MPCSFSFGRSIQPLLFHILLGYLESYVLGQSPVPLPNTDFVVNYLQAFCFCIFPKMPLAPSGYPPKPRKRGPLGGASQASLNCRFPSGASAKRRGRWPLARANPPCLVFIKVHLQGIRRNPASGVPPAERRILRVAVSLREPRQSVAAVGRSRARTLRALYL